MRHALLICLNRSLTHPPTRRRESCGGRIDGLAWETKQGVCSDFRSNELRIGFFFHRNPLGSVQENASVHHRPVRAFWPEGRVFSFSPSLFPDEMFAFFLIPRASSCVSSYTLYIYIVIDIVIFFAWLLLFFYFFFSRRYRSIRVIDAAKAKDPKGGEGAASEGDKNAHELLRTLVRGRSAEPLRSALSCSPFVLLLSAQEVTATLLSTTLAGSTGLSTFFFLLQSRHRA